MHTFMPEIKCCSMCGISPAVCCLEHCHPSLHVICGLFKPTDHFFYSQLAGMFVFVLLNMGRLCHWVEKLLCKPKSNTMMMLLFD